MKYIILVLIGFWVIQNTFGQNAPVRVTGKVVSETGSPIFSAKIKAPQAEKSVFSDTLGRFEIFSDSAFDVLIVDAYGFLKDTFILKDRFSEIVLTLKKFNAIETALIKGERNSHIQRGISKTEVITHTELKKAACCDLAGCFETQSTVQSVTTNIVTNAKELRILGLSGVYNQVLTDGMPMVQGLSYTYGISAMPGPAVYGIFVSKGTNSVLQGFESMVGQINVVPKFGNKSEQLMLNVYGNSFGENQVNITHGINKKKWNNFLTAHIVNPAREMDVNKDSFMDMTLLNRITLYNKTQFGTHKSQGLQGTVGLKFTTEKRNGGQLGFNPETDQGSNTIYGQSVNYIQPEMYVKLKYLLDAKSNIEWMSSGQYHDQNSYFGTINYKAAQKQFYSNLQWNKDWSKKNNFKSGLSLRSLNINETIVFMPDNLNRSFDGNYLKNEIIPGIFAENIFNWRAGIYQLIAGARADYHNQFGWHYTPRAVLKYEASEKTTLRFSAGTGWRTVNMFAENIGLLATSRDIVFLEVLNPEKSINLGVNATKNFEKGKWNGYVTADLYHTSFQNQFFPDYDTDANKAFITNFDGNSSSNAFQIDWVATYNRFIEFKAAYNYLDVYRIVNNEKVLLPFNAKHRLMAAVSVKSNNKKWQGDLNAHWFGRQRLPNTQNNPEQFRNADYSNPYFTLNAQVARNWKKLEIYAGAENLLNFRMDNPIMNAQNPFDEYFDTSFAWGPIRGTEVFLGLRYYPFGK